MTNTGRLTGHMNLDGTITDLDGNTYLIRSKDELEYGSIEFEDRVTFEVAVRRGRNYAVRVTVSA